MRGTGAKWNIAFWAFLIASGGGILLFQSSPRVTGQDVPQVQGTTACDEATVRTAWAPYHYTCPNGRQVTVTPDCDPAKVEAEYNEACGITSSTGSRSPQANMNSVIANEYMQVASQVGSMLGDAINQWLQKHQMEKQQEEYRQAQMERERIQAEMAQQLKWRQELAELDTQWVGPKPLEGEQPFQDMGSNFFGEYGGSRELAFAPPPSSSVTKSFSTTADQQRIANCLSKLAAQPGRSPEDAKFLSEQAAAAMSGQPVQVDTSGCQTSVGPPPQPVQAQATPLSQDQIACYTKLFDTTNRNAQRSVELVKEIDRLERAVAQDQQEIQAKQQLLKSATVAGGDDLKPTATPTSTLPAQMAAICNRRAQDTRRQSELAQEVENEYFAIRDLLPSFQTAATNSEFWGNQYAGVHDSYLKITSACDKLEPLTLILRFMKAPARTLSEGEVKLPFHLNDLDDYVVTAHLAAVSADLLTGLVARAEIRGIDQETVNNLGVLRQLSAKFEVNLKALRQVSADLADLPGCDSTKLVIALNDAPVAGEGRTAQPPQSDAVAQAQASLRRAQQAQANDEQALSRAQSEMNDLTLRLKQTQSCPSPAQGEPSKPGR
jgi:hypothetical protein